MDRDEIVRVLRAFEQVGLEYVLIGASAMGFHGIVRATEDLDLFIRPTKENVERLRAAFRVAYPGDLNIEEIKSEDLLGDYPAVRYYPPSGDLYFDVMTRLGEMASFETVEAEVKKMDDVMVNVATPLALYRLKRGTVRPIDHQDAAAPRVKSEDTQAAFDRFARHCARFWKASPRVYPRGVFKFRSAAEMAAMKAERTSVSQVEQT